MWQIDRVYIAPNESANEVKILNEKAAQGWEPYAIDERGFHYFKKCETAIGDNPFGDNLYKATGATLPATKSAKKK